MSQNDEAAQERMDILESQLLAADIENDELKKRITDLEAMEIEYKLMKSDRSYCP